MPNVDSVTVADLAQNVRLTVLQGEDYLNRQITTSDICRPSLEFAGYFKHYPAMRIQLLGITETSFAKEVPADKRREYIKRMCTPQTQNGRRKGPHPNPGDPANVLANFGEHDFLFGWSTGPT